MLFLNRLPEASRKVRPVAKPHGSCDRFQLIWRFNEEAPRDLESEMQKVALQRHSNVRSEEKGKPACRKTNCLGYVVRRQATAVVLDHVFDRPSDVFMQQRYHLRRVARLLQ